MKAHCRALWERISEYLDGELDEINCEKIEHHIRACPECASCFKSLQQTVALCKDFPKERVPDHVRKRLMENLKRYLDEER